MLKTILDSSLFSSVIGTILGGLITLFVTKSSLKKQFHEQRKIKLDSDKILIKNGLYVVKYELANNHVIANSILKKKSVSRSKDFINIEIFSYKFEDAGWREYRYLILPLLEKKEITNLINWMYFQIANWNQSNVCYINLLTEYLDLSDKVTAQIGQLISEIELELN